MENELSYPLHLKDGSLAHLFVKGRQGDQEAYHQFLTQSAALLKNFLRKRLHNKDLLEDVLQEILLTLHRARHTYLETRPIEPWLYTLAEHRLIDFLRKIKRIDQMEITESSEFLNSIADGPLIRDPLLDSVDDLLDDLSESQRKVIQMLKLEGLTVKEVAKKLSMSESNVKVTAFRGYEEIRRRMRLKNHGN